MITLQMASLGVDTLFLKVIDALSNKSSIALMVDNDNELFDLKMNELKSLSNITLLYSRGGMLPSVEAFDVLISQLSNKSLSLELMQLALKLGIPFVILYEELPSSYHNYLESILLDTVGYKYGRTETGIVFFTNMPTLSSTNSLIYNDNELHPYVLEEVKLHGYALSIAGTFSDFEFNTRMYFTIVKDMSNADSSITASSSKI